MNLTWNERQRAIREQFADFGREVVAPTSAQRDRTNEFDPVLWKQLADAGFWRIGVPREFGGDGGGLSDYMAGLEGLAGACDDCGFAVTVGAHAALLQLLLRYGTDEQRNTLLPPLMNGQIGATAATERTGGSHIAAIKTTGHQDAAGDFVLTGQKCHITNAPVADLAVIVGRAADWGKRDITLFLVQRGQEGLEFGQAEDLIGLRTSPLGPITMNQVRVNRQRVLGHVGDGLRILYWCLAFDRLSFGIIASAHVASLLPRALARATSRQAFGVPIAEHQYIQDKVVQIKVAAESSRALSYATLAALEDGDSQAETLASCVKLLSAQGIVTASLELVQLFGHMGCDREAGIERQLRDATAFRIAGGTDEMQKKNIFSQLLADFARQQGGVRV